MALSLRLRLALRSGAHTAAVVLMVCAYSYAVHRRVHDGGLDNALRGLSENVAHERATVRP